MRFFQLVLLQMASQALQGLVAYATVAGSNATDATAKKKYSVWVQLGNNWQSIAKAGINATTNEFQMQQALETASIGNEKAVADLMSKLPPIT